MKLIHFLCLFFGLMASLPGWSQRYVLTEAKVDFFSKAPLEDIEAHNTESKGILDSDKKTFAFKIPIKSFQFKSALMQEHFNENYMESKRFPFATFSGNIEGPFDLRQDGVYEVTAKGELEIHGVRQSRSIPATLTVQGGVAQLKSQFGVRLADHQIEVPQLMFQKIAEQVSVTITGRWSKQ